MGLGVALTVASHISGVMALLPVLVAALVTKQVRPIGGAAILGFGLYLAGLAAVVYLDDSVFSYVSRFGTQGGSWRALFEEPARLVRGGKWFCREFLLFSLPASTFLPAGLVLCFRTAPRTAWVLAAWLVAWPIIAFPVLLTPARTAYGGYYLPAVAVQVILAVMALESVARSRWRALAAIVLGILPALALQAGSEVGLGTWFVCAGALVVLVGWRRGESLRDTGAPSTGAAASLGLLHLAALAYSLLAYVPDFSADPVRERIRELRAFTGSECLHFLYEPSGPTAYRWVHELHVRGESQWSCENLRLVDYATPEQATAIVDRWRKKRRQAQRLGWPVYLTVTDKVLLRRSRAAPFVEELRAAGFVAPEGAPEGLWLVGPPP